MACLIARLESLHTHRDQVSLYIQSTHDSHGYVCDNNLQTNPEDGMRIRQ